MRVAKLALAAILVVGSWAAGPAVETRGADAEKGEKPKLRVGTFDSRAVAIAYFNSEVRYRHTRQMMEEYKKAKAGSDQQKVKEMEAQHRVNEERIHQQAFGTASVANILAEVKDQLPGVAREAGVDVMVSQWAIAYQGESAQFVDVTGLLVKLYHPSEKALGWIKDLEKHAPIPPEVLKKELKTHLEEHK